MAAVVFKGSDECDWCGEEQDVVAVDSPRFKGNLCKKDFWIWIKSKAAQEKPIEKKRHEAHDGVASR